MTARSHGSRRRCPSSRRQPAARHPQDRRRAPRPDAGPARRRRSTRDHVGVVRRASAASRARTPLPLPYPHLLAFRLHMEIMTDRVVPVPRDRHRAPRELDHPAPPDRASARRLQVTARARQPAPARQGSGLRPASPTVHSRRRAGVGGDLDVPAPRHGRRRRADRARRTRTPRRTAPSGGCPATSAAGTPAVSGDHNPIHLYAADRQGVRLPAPDRARHVVAWPAASARSRTGCPTRSASTSPSRSRSCCPGSVAFGSRPTDDGYAFSLTQPEVRRAAPGGSDRSDP